MIGAGFADGLASCIMVTKASRWTGIALPIGAASYLAQSYKLRELVMVTADPCDRMLDFARSLENTCTVVELGKESKMGALRQAGVVMAAGDFVATWDDDDWSSVFRLEEQIEALRWIGASDACCLTRVTVADEVNGRRFLSPRHFWDPTMVARRESMTDYDPNKMTGEDGEVIARFNRVIGLEKPELYRYRIHADSLSGQLMAQEWYEQAQLMGGVL